MLENVLMCVSKFYIPIDFIILETENDTHILFLATARAIIDVKNEKLIFKIRQEKVEFNVFKYTTQPSNVNLCNRIDITEECVYKMLKQVSFNDALNSCLIHNSLTTYENTKIAIYAQYLEATKTTRVIACLKFEI